MLGGLECLYQILCQSSKSVVKLTFYKKTKTKKTHTLQPAGDTTGKIMSISNFMTFYLISVLTKVANRLMNTAFHADVLLTWLKISNNFLK